MANEKRGCQILSFINKNQLNIKKNGRHIGTLGTSKSANELTLASPSLQTLFSWSARVVPLRSDHCAISENVQNKISELQTVITQLNNHSSNWHLFTSNEAWKKVTSRNQTQSVEALIEDLKKSKMFQNLRYQ